MSDDIQHECGVTLLRLRRNLTYYARKYGSPYYGYEKLSLLLEKQHNRGQDGAGIACIGLDTSPGRPFYEVERSCAQPALDDLLARLGERLAAAQVNPLRRHALLLGFAPDGVCLAGPVTRTAGEALTSPFHPYRFGDWRLEIGDWKV